MMASTRPQTPQASGQGSGLRQARERYLAFLDLCRSAEGAYRLTPASDASAFATCFWIFGVRLLRRDDLLTESRRELSESICRAIRAARTAGVATRQLQAKPYRQLLTFALSALSVLGTLVDDPLEEFVVEQLPTSVEKSLTELGCLSGRPQSGNQAMFMAIFLLHARDRLGMAVDGQIQEWVRCHLAAMNRFGYWGSERGMTTLQFQNGYHQYEILEYLGVQTGRAATSAAAVARLADARGHFAPYPGGGGCFDYDAVFMLTPEGRIPSRDIAVLLERTSATLLTEQQVDGGFCESLLVRPRSPANLARGIRHALHALPSLPPVVERLRYLVALQRPKYDRIDTHWSTYSRRWDESDLWDSWFRMLTLARIECALDEKAVDTWGFIDFPGIGFHPSMRRAS